jgi:hypothetical protein
MRATSGGLGRAASTVDRDHGGEPRPAQPPDRIYTETLLCSHTPVRTRGSASSIITAVRGMIGSCRARADPHYRDHQGRQRTISTRPE